MIQATPNLDWLLLTKRPENYYNFFPNDWYINGFPQNIWLGTTIYNQKEYDINWPLLRDFQDLSQERTRTSFVNPEAGQKGFLSALKDPTEAQRNAFIAFGLGLAGSTGDLSQRLAAGLGQGVGALQKTREQEKGRELQGLQFQMKELGLEGEDLTQQFEQQKYLNTLDKQARTEQREETRLDLYTQGQKREETRLDLYTQGQDRAKTTFEQQQQQRQVDLGALNSTKFSIPLLDADGNPQETPVFKNAYNQWTLASGQPLAQDQISQIYQPRSSDVITVTDTGTTITRGVSGQRTSRPPTKTQLDLSSEMAGATTLASKVANVVYDPIAFEKSIGGREYIVPGVGPLFTSAEALLDPDVAGYVARRERIAIDLALPFMRALAPVTDVDAEKLQMTKGFEMRLSPEQTQKKWEREMLPENAALIYANNMEYKGENPQQGPERAAINMLKYAEKSFGDAMAGRKMTIYNQAQQTERLNDLLAMYPSTSQASNLQGSNGAYEINGRVVSDQFIMSLAKSMDVTPDDLVSVLGIKPF